MMTKRQQTQTIKAAIKSIVVAATCLGGATLGVKLGVAAGALVGPSTAFVGWLVGFVVGGGAGLIVAEGLMEAIMPPTTANADAAAGSTHQGND
ncbi:MAG: hypothetical protein J7M25_15645 [Deltaproteobacteria bacterium]|nr:hypothetical protein [Deltaproteobacteria bacterium]